MPASGCYLSSQIILLQCRRCNPQPGEHYQMEWQRKHELYSERVSGDAKPGVRQQITPFSLDSFTSPHLPSALADLWRRLGGIGRFSSKSLALHSAEVIGNTAGEIDDCRPATTPLTRL